MKSKIRKVTRIIWKRDVRPLVARAYGIYNAMKVTYWSKFFVAMVKMKMGIPTPLRNDDRRILERIILPYFAENSAFYRILFIGCAWYTWHYKRIFYGKEYWTIEPTRIRAVFGAERHIVGYMLQIDQYFKKSRLDLIICNGVLGFGLNNPQEIEDSFRKCFLCLREGGVLVVGWDDIKERAVLPLEKCRSLQQFHHFVFPSLGTSEYLTETQWRHTFNFYIKPST